MSNFMYLSHFFYANPVLCDCAKIYVFSPNKSNPFYFLSTQQKAQ